jgi:hypothetical protein
MPKTSTNIANVMSNEKIYNLSPERVNFYMQLMESIMNPDPTVAEAVIKRENLTRNQRRQMTDKLDSIRKFWMSQKEEDKSILVKEINAKLGTNILTQGVQLVEPPKQEVKKMDGGALTIEDLKQAIGLPKSTPPVPLKDAFNAIGDNKVKQEIATKYQAHPLYSPTNEGINWTDRTIFIAITYIIRSIAIFFVEWGLYSGFIKSFSSAFSLYFGMYLAIYGLFLFLVNSREKDKIFRFLFFYANFDSDDGKGILRVLLHVICIFTLLPIPYIVKEYREYQESEVLSFTDKSNILSGLDKFSLYAWILTSIVVMAV